MEIAVWWTGAAAGSGWGLVCGLLIALWVALQRGDMRPRNLPKTDRNLMPDTEEPYLTGPPARFGRTP